MYSFLDRISRRHSVTLVSFIDEFESTLVDDVKKLPIELYVIPRQKGKQKTTVGTIILILHRLIKFLQSVIYWRPYYVAKYTNRHMAKLIRSLTNRTQYDIVQIEFAQMALYKKHIKCGQTILHEHDVTFRPAYRRYRKESNPFIRMFKFIEFCRWAKFEMQYVKYYDQVLTVTHQDTRLLHRFSGINHITYFPRGIDMPPEQSTPCRPNSILFVGSFSHQPNVDAALHLIEKIFPIVKQSCSDATLDIIGAHAPNELITASLKQSGVSVLGYVEDVLPYLQSHSLFAAPIHFGGGIKLKIMHAMASGIPVITTHIGVEGLDGVNDTNVCMADTDQTFATKICYFLSNQDKAFALGVNGRELIKKNYAWDSVITLYEQTCDGILTVHPEKHYIKV